jgi:integrase
MAKDLLSDRAVKALTNPGRYTDGGGLYVQISPTGTKSWLFRYKMHGAERLMGLGAYPDVSLKAARLKADYCRQQRGDGLDPKVVRDEEIEQQRLEAARAVTFRQCAETYIATKEAGWKNDKHKQQWRNTLETYAYPLLGKLPVQVVDAALVLKVLHQPVAASAGKKAGLLWNARPETAMRVRGRLEAILDWAKLNNQRTGENPARWRGNLAQVLTDARRTEHHAALPFEDTNAFLKELHGRSATAARAFEFLILTAARTGEVLGARWDEINESTGVWTVPATRMKRPREHRVPLSAAALSVLEQVRPLKRDEGFVFPNANGKAPLSNMAMLTLLRRMGRTNITAHGFRSTFRDWTAECTNFPGEVAEAALAHAVGDKVEAAYRRGDLFEKRRQLMSEWARYCTTPKGQKGGANVAQFPGVAA